MAITLLCGQPAKIYNDRHLCGVYTAEAGLDCYIIQIVATRLHRKFAAVQRIISGFFATIAALFCRSYFNNTMSNGHLDGHLDKHRLVKDI